MELRKSHYLKLVHTASNIGQDHRAFSGISEHKDMFGWVDFREDGKKKKKIGQCLVEGKGGKKNDRTRVFSFWAHQNVFSPNLGETWREHKWTKTPLCNCAIAKR